MKKKSSWWLREISTAVFFVGGAFMIGSIIAIYAEGRDIATLLLQISLGLAVIGGLFGVVEDFINTIDCQWNKKLNQAYDLVDKALSSCYQYKDAEKLAEDETEDFYLDANEQFYSDTVSNVSEYLLAAKHVLDQM